MNDDEQLHWYLLTFLGTVNGGMHIHNAYGSSSKPRVNLKMIEAAKASGNIHPGFALMSVSYLGLMSEAEFTEKVNMQAWEAQQFAGVGNGPEQDRSVEE